MKWAFGYGSFGRSVEGSNAGERTTMYQDEQAKRITDGVFPIFFYLQWKILYENIYWTKQFYNFMY